jgi:hypothetical protein
MEIIELKKINKIKIEIMYFIFFQFLVHIYLNKLKNI